MALNLEAEPEMIKRLLARFKKASGVLEQVNTPALIEQIYSQEKVGFFFCEQIDYFCRILPNLLLAFGLLGTFFGITVNLTALSHTLSQTNYSDVSALVRELQKPLHGMGTAFTASLVGLGFSAVLTFVNFKVNTALVKFQLISSLEDYLDNIYQPTIEGHSRLDKAVEKMVLTFSEFLSRFGVTVREAVESSLKDKLQEIFEANIKATNLATEVYSRFLNASGTLERGAVIFRESAEVIERTQFPDKLSTITEGLANAQKEISQSSLLLNDSMKFTESATKLLHNSVAEIGHLNEKTTQVLELTQGSQQSLSEIIPQLHQGAQMFQPAVKTLDKLQERIETRADSLEYIQIELTKLVANLEKNTDKVSIENQALCEQIVRSIKDLGRIGESENAVPTHARTAETSLDPKFQKQFQKASIAYMNGNYKEAATVANALLLEKYPNNPELLLLQGNIYYQMKDYSTARKAYQLVLYISTDLQLKEKARTGLSEFDGTSKKTASSGLHK